MTSSIDLFPGASLAPLALLKCLVTGTLPVSCIDLTLQTLPIELYGAFVKELFCGSLLKRILRLAPRVLSQPGLLRLLATLRVLRQKNL